MAHSTFYFLTEVSDGKASDERIESEVLYDFYRYSVTHCDENNWHHPKLIVLKTGRLIAPKDAKDRYEIERLGQLPEKTRWPTVMRMALELAARMVFEDYPDAGPDMSKPSKALVKHIRQSAPKLLSGEYRQAILCPGENHRRAHLAQCYEQFCGCEIIPFARRFSAPYDGYAGFDLRSYGSGTRLKNTSAVLFMDIHT